MSKEGKITLKDVADILQIEVGESNERSTSNGISKNMPNS